MDMGITLYKLLIFGIFLFGVPVLVSYRMLSFTDFLAVVELLLSWPVIALIIVLFLTRNFKDAVDSFIRNMGLKLPGGFELQSQQPAPVDGGGTNEDSKPSETQDDAQESIIEQLDNTPQLDDIERQRLQNEVNLAFDWVNYWRRMYLNYYFVPHTKQALLWFTQYQNQTRNTFNLAWQKTIPDPAERARVLDALFEHGTIQEVNGTIQTTAEGNAFLQFIGLIPPAPGAQ